MPPGHSGPTIAVVIPVLADTDAAAQLLAQLPARPDVEVVVVDGTHDEALTRVVLDYPGTTLLRTAPGRAHQMNAGAAATSAEWLLFLHADSRLPPGWCQSIVGLERPVVGGWFRFALDDDAWQARVMERLVSWRVKWLRLPYGDQGFFVRGEVFRTLGGYREWPLLEDVDFVRRLLEAGPVCELPLPLLTSARRWRRDGWLRRSLRNVAITTLFFAGVSPHRLARWYGGRARGSVRGTGLI